MNRANADILFTQFCSTGDPQSLGEVFDLTAPELARIASHLCGDRDTAEDFVQETFLTAIEKRSEFDPELRVLPWLLGILANLARRRGQAEASRRRRIPSTADASESAASSAQRREFWTTLRAAIDELSEPYQSVLREHLEHGRSAQTIAADRECPASTVRNQIRRGMARLQQVLPAGITGVGVAAMLPAQSLVRIRKVLEFRAEDLLGTAAAGGVSSAAVFGVWIMKKYVVAACVVLLLGLGLWLSRDVWWVPQGIELHRNDEPGAQTQMASANDPSDPTRETLRPERGAENRADVVHGDIVVRVVWSHDRRPVSGVSVCLTRTPARPTRLARRTVTDVEGRAQVTGLEPGRWFAHALIDAVESVQVTRGSSASVELELAEHGVMDGRVVDDAGAPVADARVFATGGWLVGVSQVARTDRAGRFTYRSPGPNVGLFAAKPGHGRSAVIEHLSWRGERNRATLVLGRGARPLRGVVVDGSGEPIAGAGVTIRMSSPASVGYPISFAVHGPDPVRALSDGRFSIANVLPGETSYVVRARGFATATGWFPHTGEDGVELRVEMQRAAVIRGSVRDPRGRPVVGARISLGDAISPHPLTGIAATTSVRGEFELDAVPGLEHRLIAEHPEHGFAETTIDLRNRGPHRWYVTLDPGPMIVGRVVDPSGAGLAEWHVVATTPYGRHPRQSRVRTNSEGHFRLLGCSDVEHTVSVMRDSGLFAAVRAQASGVVPGRELTLTVDPKTRPSAYLKGRIRRPAGFEDQLVRLQISSGSWGGTVGVPSNGEFRLGPLAPGEYQIYAINYRTALGGLDLGPFQVKAGEERDIGTHALETPTVIRLHPSRRDGRPVRVLGVLWRRDEGKEDRWLWSEGMPLFHRTFQPGRYKFEFRGTDHLPASLEADVRAGQINELNLRLEPARSCVLRLRRRDGSAVPERVQAYLHRDGQDPKTVSIVLYHGEARQPLLPGSYRVEIAAGQGIAGSAGFVVAEVVGPDLRVAIDVQ